MKKAEKALFMLVLATGVFVLFPTITSAEEGGTCPAVQEQVPPTTGGGAGGENFAFFSGSSDTTYSTGGGSGQNAETAQNNQENTSETEVILIGNTTNTNNAGVPGSKDEALESTVGTQEANTENASNWLASLLSTPLLKDILAWIKSTYLWFLGLLALLIALYYYKKYQEEKTTA